MTDFVRVKEGRAEISVSKELAELHNLKPLDKPASRNGRALPAKYDPLKKKAVQAADYSDKENES